MSVLSQCYSIIIDRGISAPGHGNYVANGLNAIDKCYVYQLMYNVQLKVSKTLYSQILMHYFTQKNDVSLDKKFQKHLYKDHHKHEVIDQVKDIKRASKRKWTDREFHVQDSADVAHKDVKMYCDTNQFPALPFCVSHPKPHGSRGSSKHYHLNFDPKLGHGICEIICIPCACVGCTSMLDKPWISGIPSNKRARYQPVTNCTYCPVMGSYNNLNIIELIPKPTPFEAFYNIYKIVIDGIIENMASLGQSGMYGAINKDDTTKNGFYAIQFLSEA